MPLKLQSHDPSFTLIELMAASTVLSVVLLMMVGMQDQMSKAWSNANRRTEATREARAGLRMLTEDFLHYYIRDVHINPGASRANYNPTTIPIPIVYFSDAAKTISQLKIPNAQSGSQALFFLSQRRSGAGKEADQLSAVGYYIASTAETNVNGFKTTNFHLFRYINTNAYSILQTYTGNTSSLANLFPNVGPDKPQNNEILARNALNLRIYFYATNLPTTGTIYRFEEYDFRKTTSAYGGNRCVFELTSYPETVASSILQTGSGQAAWTNANNLKRYGRTFEITMDLERSLTQ